MLLDSHSSSHSSFTIVYFFSVTWTWQLWFCFKIKIEIRSRQNTLRARQRFCMAKVSKNASTNWTRDISKRSQDWLKTSSRLVPHFWVSYFRDSGCHQHLGNLSIDPIHSTVCIASVVVLDTIESWSRDILELGFKQVLVSVWKAKGMNLWVLTTTLCLGPNPTYML